MQSYKREKENLNFWNIVFSVFFLGVFMFALGVMEQMRGGYLIYVQPYDALLMALAAFRITRLVVYDKITRWFRELFADSVEYEDGGIHYVEIKPFGSGFRHTIYDLLSCPWCIGFWSSLVIVFCYFVFPWAWTVILFLAIAGVGSLFQLLANMIGWKAENLKLDAAEKEVRLSRNHIDYTSLGK